MRRRVLSILSAALLLTSLFSVPCASAMIGPQYVNTANGKGVYLRTGPSKDYDIVTSIPYGAQADTYEYYNGTWAYVSYGNNYGYAMSRYFSSYQPSPKPKPTNKPSGGGGSPSGNMFNGFYKADYYVMVRPSTPSGFVNMRWAPSKTQAIEGTYYAGYTLRVLQQNNEWAQVYDESSGTCGFIMLAFLSTSMADIDM